MLVIIPILPNFWINLSLAVPVISIIPDVKGGRANAGIPIAGYGNFVISSIPVFNACVNLSFTCIVLVKVVIDEYKLFNCLTKLFLFLISLAILAELGHLSTDANLLLIIFWAAVVPNSSIKPITIGINIFL